MLGVHATARTISFPGSFTSPPQRERGKKKACSYLFRLNPCTPFQNHPNLNITHSSVPLCSSRNLLTKWQQWLRFFDNLISLSFPCSPQFTSLISLLVALHVTSGTLDCSLRVHKEFYKVIQFWFVFIHLLCNNSGWLSVLHLSLGQL